jgi:hypothetical protein
MTKFFNKSFILALLLTTVSYIFSGNDWWNWHDNDNDHYSEHYGSIDYPAIKRIVEQEMDHFFQPHEQTTAKKATITHFKDQAKREICQETKQMCSNHSCAKELAVQLAEDYAVNFVEEWAGHIAQERLKNPPVNPNLINKSAIIRTIKQIIRSQAHIELQQKDRRLTKLVQNLEKNVEVLIRQEIDYALGY